MKVAEILSGKAAAQEVLTSLAKRTEKLLKKGIVPCLAVIRLGEKADDVYYEKSVSDAAFKAGANTKNFVLGENAEEQEVEKLIRELNEDGGIHGILLMRPLPGHINEDKVRNLILSEKDVDAATDASLDGVFTGSGIGYAPCAAEAVVRLLQSCGVELCGKNAVVVGRSPVVGKPVAMLLLEKDATVTICHSKTENLRQICQNADIIVTAAGKAGLITKDFVNPKQTVVDVGINLDKNGKLCGDVDFESCVTVVKALTPVPGGVGAMTSAVLMSHLISAAEKVCPEN